MGAFLSPPLTVPISDGNDGRNRDVPGRQASPVSLSRPTRATSGPGPPVSPSSEAPCSREPNAGQGRGAPARTHEQLPLSWERLSGQTAMEELGGGTVYLQRSAQARGGTRALGRPPAGCGDTSGTWLSGRSCGTARQSELASGVLCLSPQVPGLLRQGASLPASPASGCRDFKQQTQTATSSHLIPGPPAAAKNAFVLKPHV